MERGGGWRLEGGLPDDAENQSEEMYEELSADVLMRDDVEKR